VGQKDTIKGWGTFEFSKYASPGLFLAGGFPYVYLDGKLTYRDCFGDPHEERWCWSVTQNDKLEPLDQQDCARS